MNIASALTAGTSNLRGNGFSLRAFWNGFTQPSRFAFLLMSGVFFATTLLMIIVVTPATLAGPLGDYVPRSADNDEAFATIQALRLADPRTPIGKAPRVYVIGNSRIAQAFASDARLARDLRASTRKDWDVFFLTTGRQGSLDETALAEYATQRQAGVVVLSVGFDRYENDVAEYLKYYRMSRIGYQSDWADAQVRGLLKSRPRRRTGIYLIDNRRFFLLNASVAALRLLAHWPAERKIDSYIFEQKMHSLATYRAEILASLRSNYIPGKLGAAFLEDTVRRLKQRGNRIVLFDVPVSPALLDHAVDSHRYAVHLRESEALSAKLGAYYCGPQAAALPPAFAYRDYYHIADPSSQERLRRVLAECVANVSSHGSHS